MSDHRHSLGLNAGLQALIAQHCRLCVRAFMALSDANAAPAILAAIPHALTHKRFGCGGRGLAIALSIPVIEP